MKKVLTSIVALLAIFLIPTSVFAATDLVLEDGSAGDIKKILVNVDTNDETLSEITLSVEASSNVELVDVVAGTTKCDAFVPTITENIVKISCTLTEAAALDGDIAVINFTSTSTDYTFTVLNDTTLDLDTSDVGTITNIKLASTDDSESLTATNENTDEELTATADKNSTAENSTTKNALLDYLPYILIGGSVVLLISILGIIFSRKEKKPEQLSIPSTPVVPAPQDPSPAVVVEEKPQTLGSIYGAQPQSAPVSEPVTPQVSSQENKDLETLIQAAPDDTPEEISTPNMQAQEESDLQALMNATTMSAQEETVSDPTTEEEKPIQEVIQPAEEVQPIPEVTQPTEEPQPIPEITQPVVETPAQPLSEPQDIMPTPPVADLQDLINKEVAQLETVVQQPPVVEQTPVQVPPVVNQDNGSEGLPPIPPAL